MELPRIISVDDHCIEPPDVWQNRLPRRYKPSGPRVERRYGYTALEWTARGGYSTFIDDPEKCSPKSRWGDHWIYEDLRWPLTAAMGAVGGLRELEAQTPVTFEELDPGCYVPSARLDAMTLNYTDASLSFPTMPRFCGQTFLERSDKELACLCVRAYNDWMIDEWCGGAGAGRLIPQTLIPLWDVDLASEEVRRCAEKGSHAVAFSEVPPFLGLPSIHSGFWDPLFDSCQGTETVINMHIGSGSRPTVTSPDAPLMVAAALTSTNAQLALSDWLLSGVLARFPRLKIALSEGQVGWMPFMLERLDRAWGKLDQYDRTFRDIVPRPPSEYVAGRVFGCVFDDLHGLKSRSQIGMKQIMFETDYPHLDSTFPSSRQTAERLAVEAGLDDHETWQLLRGNAIECYGLSRFGISE